MKVIKKNDIASLFVPYQLQGKNYLSISMILGFDLLNPSQSMSEQALWDKVNTSLEGGFFDAGMPKIQAEWLLSGACFSGDKPRERVRISVSIAGNEKQLDVYGDRYWQIQQDKLVPSSPQAFLRQAITWEKAWGGVDINENKVGLNLYQEGYPLACVFYSHDIKNDAAEKAIYQPACLLPLAIDHPMRQACMGTYDDLWFRERWPSVPQDFDWHFFNQAPLDQRVQDDFTGGESFHLVNLHPDIEMIKGQLPHYSPRVFVRQLTDLKYVVTAEPAKLNAIIVNDEDNSEQNTFEEEIEYCVSEITLRNDTVWFFPEQELGLRIFRGNIEIQDEEALDVADILLLKEDKDKPKQTLMFYADYIKHYSAAKEAEPEAMTALNKQAEQAKIELTTAKKTISDVPKYLYFKQQQFNNKLPTPLPSVAGGAQLMEGHINSNLSQLSDLKSHLFLPDKMKGLLNKSTQELELLKINLAQQQQLKMKLEYDIATDLKNINIEKPNFEGKPEYNVEVQAAENKVRSFADKVGTPKSKNPWHDKVSQLISESFFSRLFTSKREMLLAYGYRILTIKQHFISFLYESSPFFPQEWGLSPDDISDEIFERLLKGWMVVDYKESVFTGLQIREDLFDFDEHLIVPGSQFLPWHNELQLGLPLLICRDRCIAWLFEQDLSEWVNVIELPSVDAELSDEIKQAIAQAPQCFLFQQGIMEEELPLWKEAFFELEPISLDNNILIQDAYKEGIDLTVWLMDYLRPEKGQTTENLKLTVNKKKDKALFSVPKFTQSDAENSFNQQQTKMYQQLGLPEGKPLVEAIAALGEMKATEFKAQLPTSEAREAFDAGLKTLRNPNISQQAGSKVLADASSKALSMLDKDLANLEPVQKKIMETEIARLKPQLSDAISQMQALESKVPKDKIKEGGQITDFETLSRGQVLILNALNHSLAKKDLSELDLSGVDLSGVDLSESILNETIFTGSDLTGAKLNAVIATQAVFDKAILHKAELKQAIMCEVSFKQTNLSFACLDEASVIKANFLEADLQAVSAVKLMANEANFSQANFRHSQLFQASLLNTCLENASFEQCDAVQIKCFEASAQGSVWTGAKLNKALFWSA
uniref:DUF2169 family type VI secretion system accessory protein n=1 Tax=uncultured Shewanella sp. TaxID=173975 RepID=UPI002604D1B4